jgi:ribosomal protein L24E
VTIRNNNTIYPQHCEIRRTRNKVELIRGNDKCFIKVNGQVMKTASIQLKHGDEIELGVIPKKFTFSWISSVQKHTDKNATTTTTTTTPTTDPLNTMNEEQQKPEAVTANVVESDQVKPPQQQQQQQQPTTVITQIPEPYEEVTDQPITQTDPSPPSQKTTTKQLVVRESDNEEDEDETFVESYERNLPPPPPQTHSSKRRFKMKDALKNIKKRKRKNSSEETTVAKKSRGSSQDREGVSSSQDSNTSLNLDHFVQSLNINSLARLQQLQSEVDQLKLHNAQLMEQSSAQKNDSSRSYVDQVQNALLSDKLKFERMYNEKVGELMASNNEKKLLEQKYSDLEKQYNEISRRDEENKIRSLYLEEKRKNAEYETTLQIIQDEKIALEQTFEKLKKEHSSFRKQIDDLRMENDRYKLQIQNRESHISQTLRVNVEAAQQIDTVVNTIINEFTSTGQHIVEAVSRSVDKLKHWKNEVRSQTTIIAMDIDREGSPDDQQLVVGGDSGGHDYIDEIQSTPTRSPIIVSRSNNNSRNTSSVNQDVEESRRILNRRPARIGQLQMVPSSPVVNTTAAAVANSTIPKSIGKLRSVTFQEDSPNRIQWTTKRSKTSTSSEQSPNNNLSSLQYFSNFQPMQSPSAAQHTNTQFDMTNLSEEDDDDYITINTQKKRFGDEYY